MLASSPAVRATKGAETRRAPAATEAAGQIGGTVRDQAGAAVVGAAVKLLSAAGAQAEAAGRDGLAGPVKEVRHETSESAPGGGVARRGRSASYDVKGNKIEERPFGPDGSVAQRFVYTFDTQGRATGYEEYSSGLSTPRRHIYVLGEKGERVEYKIVQPDGAAGEKRLYTYDAQGRLVEERLHEHKGHLLSRNVHTYDAAGRPVSQTRYDADGSISSVAKVSYDAQGRPVERTRHEGDVLTYSIRYRYDSRGRVVEQETVGSVLDADVPPAEAHPPGRVSYVYKGGKQPKEATHYGPDGTARERIVFQYDSRGNWISKTYFSLTAAGAHRAEYRTITYF
jgi:YD repeat-containing protein